MHLLILYDCTVIPSIVAYSITALLITVLNNMSKDSSHKAREAQYMNKTLPSSIKWANNMLKHHVGFHKVFLNDGILFHYPLCNAIHNDIFG